MDSAPSTVESAGWLHRLVDRVGQVRSRLDFNDVVSPESTEDLALTAVLMQLLTTPFEVISKGINTSKLDDYAPGLRSRASRRFGGASGLASFVLAESLRPDRSELTDALLESAAQALLDPAAEHEQVLLDLGTAFFNAMCDDPCLRLQTFAWLGAHEVPELRRSFEELYASLGGRVADGLVFFFESWGREPIDGVSHKDIATGLTSMAEGLAMRTAVDPDSVPPDFAGIAAVALIKSLTREAAATAG